MPDTAPRPKVAVWKFASCDGCQLSLLDCEDELLPIADRIEIAHFLEASRAVVEGLLNIEKISSVRLLKILTTLAAKRTRAIQEKLVGWFLLAGGDIASQPPSF